MRYKLSSFTRAQFKLEPCDVFLHEIEGNSLWARMQRWAVGDYGHVSMYIGRSLFNTPFIFESDGRGAGIESLQYKHGQMVIVMRPKINEEKKIEVVSRAIELASDDQAYYDYLAIIRSCIPRVLSEKLHLPIPDDYRRDAMVICSEVIAEVFWRADLDILPETTVPLPDDFADSLFLKPVARGRLMEDILPQGYPLAISKYISRRESKHGNGNGY